MGERIISDREGDRVEERKVRGRGRKKGSAECGGDKTRIVVELKREFGGKEVGVVREKGGQRRTGRGGGGGK